MFDVQRLGRQLKFAAISSGLEGAALVPAALRPSRLAGRGVIFTLHHVRPAEDHAFLPNAFLSITPEFLDAALQTALAEGLVPVRLEELPSRLSDPTDKRRYVAVTLDDGYRDNAEHAAPVFRKYGVPYTIFVTSGFVERTHSPWWETAERLIRKNETFAFDFGFGPETLNAETGEEKFGLFDRITDFVKTQDENVAVDRINDAARRYGIDPTRLADELVMGKMELAGLAAADRLVTFGAHTVSHPNLKRVADRHLQREISDSADAVETYVGRRPTTFAYPYGWPAAVGPREAKALVAAGFELGVTTQPGVLRGFSDETRMVLKRVSLNGYYQKPRYVRALISGIPFAFV